MASTVIARSNGSSRGAASDKKKKGGKSSKGKAAGKQAVMATSDADENAAGAAAAESDKLADKLSGKAYARALKKLHVELVALQEWVKARGLRVCIVFEGRDGACKGGTIKAIT
jgi:polyphosphate kinase 2 (PPK2 family)